MRPTRSNPHPVKLSLNDCIKALHSHVVGIDDADNIYKLNNNEWGLNFLKSCRNNENFLNKMNVNKPFEGVTLKTPMEQICSEQPKFWNELFDLINNDQSYVLCGLKSTTYPKQIYEHGLPKAVPELLDKRQEVTNWRKKSADLLTIGNHFTALHQDWGWTNRVQSIPDWNTGLYKLFVIQKKKNYVKTGNFIRMDAPNTSVEDQLRWIVNNIDYFDVVVIKPGETVLHDGKYWHAVVTQITDYEANPLGLGLSVGHTFENTVDLDKFSRGALPRKLDKDQYFVNCSRPQFQVQVRGKTVTSKMTQVAKGSSSSAAMGSKQRNIKVKRAPPEGRWKK